MSNKQDVNAVPFKTIEPGVSADHPVYQAAKKLVDEPGQFIKEAEQGDALVLGTFKTFSRYLELQQLEIEIEKAKTSFWRRMFIWGAIGVCIGCIERYCVKATIS